MQDDKYWKKLEYVPIAAAIERLTGNNESQDILKRSIISGCINGQIGYRIKGGLPSDTLSSFLPITMSQSDFVENDGIEINRASFERWSNEMDSVKDKHKLIDGEIDKRTERTYLNTVGALLSCITGDFNQEVFSSETQLREFLHEKYKGYRGVNKRTLANIFSDAKKALDE